MTSDAIISWLLEGDVSIQYQTHRDLLGVEEPQLQKRISREGWGARFLSCQLPNGHWGKSFYQPKWTSTHYTLLDLRNLCIFPHTQAIATTIDLILKNEKGPDGGINPSGTIIQSDVCINGMALNYASYFHANEEALRSVVDLLRADQLNDGGFNCQLRRKGATHSSLHSTLSVLEGIHEYERNGYGYRLKELRQATREAQEFVLRHKLFRSHRTGEIINPNFLRLRYPGRWYYDILRAMDYFQSARVAYDARMDDAINVIIEKRNVDGRWTLAGHYPGQQHFEMEKPRMPSRWNTLRALRVLMFYKK